MHGINHLRALRQAQRVPESGLGYALLHGLPGGWDRSRPTPWSVYLRRRRALPHYRADHEGFLGLRRLLRMYSRTASRLIVLPGSVLQYTRRRSRWQSGSMQYFTGQPGLGYLPGRPQFVHLYTVTLSETPSRDGVFPRPGDGVAGQYAYVPDRRFPKLPHVVESGSDARTLAKGSSCFGVVPTAFAIGRCLTDPRA